MEISFNQPDWKTPEIEKKLIKKLQPKYNKIWL